MKSNNWKDFAERIGIAAIVASLIFVGLQMRQAEVIAKSEMHASYLANRIEMHAAIIEHSDIWKRGNKGEKLEEDESAIFSRQVFIVNDEAYIIGHKIFNLGEMSINKCYGSDQAEPEHYRQLLHTHGGN